MDHRPSRWRLRIWLFPILLLTILGVIMLNRSLPLESGWHTVLLILFAVLINLGFAAAFGWFSGR